MILLGVDLGERRVGFAVTDAGERLALPSGYAEVDSLEDAAREVLAKAAREAAGLVVLGNPLNMDGRAGPKAREAARFGDMLVAAGLEVVLWDERLTTSDAERLLMDAGLKRRQRRALIDANSAQRLLAAHMEWRRRRTP